MKVLESRLTPMLIIMLLIMPHCKAGDFMDLVSDYALPVAMGTGAVVVAPIALGKRQHEYSYKAVRMKFISLIQGYQNYDVQSPNM